ncbi:hypothetical protein WKR88_14150 [Trinickia caryophylli]|uniref:Invasion protein B family protein n=1 Tax=Trinickia caryophylli TaxID=28094 RepID=A0A1X7GJP7_TRICW|nr:hypothetical protein [Trinickia caryophylli]PMS09924.1 hypothetical protein C0Z17_22880 [Trinickia caryophylli]TRX14960.1 hypothetical protein FNF07_27525 [Trinickia caryophylli]WQE14816.1 hypothetical protein U0034_19845 [Trinickia caryophylli]SMF70756.1 Invasion protein B family protein [Trinickia caryophylli]GLU35018.1 hypothetical protein Busp01_48600 [Trinickia caryophylli]
MYTTLHDTLRAALIEAGAPDDRLGDFDQHSTIALELGDAGTILLSHDNDRLWAWSQIGWLRAPDIERHAAAILARLQDPMPGCVTGQAVFGKRNDVYEIKLLLEGECARSPQKLYEALDAFFALLIALHETVSV